MASIFDFWRVRGAALAALFFVVFQGAAGATASLDEGENDSTLKVPPERTERAAPADNGTNVTNSPPAADGEVLPPEQSNSAPELIMIDAPVLTPGEVLYSVRFPLAMTGSRVPTMSTGAPAQSPPNVFLPAPAISDNVHPLSWRMTAEALRNQTAGKSLIACNFACDLQNTAQSLIREGEESGFRLSGMSLRAGHLLLRIPRDIFEQDQRLTPAQSYSDAWLIITLTQLGNGSTDMRLKIQSRSPARATALVNEFVQRAQGRATGKKLL